MSHISKHVDKDVFESFEAVSAYVESEASGLFVILDCCDEPDVLDLVVSGRFALRSLFTGDAQRDFWAVAPYIAKVDQQLLSWIQETLHTSRWGLLAVSGSPLEVVRLHFKRLLTVKEEGGSEMYFRFYDPHVMDSFLKVCSKEERSTLFGPISRYLLPDGDTFKSCLPSSNSHNSFE